MTKRQTLKVISAATLLSAVGTLSAMAPATATASEWPQRPVHLVVPFAPGGSNDVIARRLAESLRQSTGQSFVIENKAGAGGVVGANYVAKSAPNGYTFLFISGSIATSAAVQKTPYDVKQAFEAVSLVASAPFVVVTRKDFPAKNMPELLAYARANPGKINFGSAGLGDSSQMATELLANMAGVKMQTIGYKGQGPAQLDLIAGRLDMIITTMASIGGTPADNVPKLAFTSEKRNPDYPNIPTVKEQTGLDYVVDVWWGVFGPAGVDKEIVAKMNAEIGKAVKDPQFAKFLKSIGAYAAHSTPAALKKLMDDDVDRWTATAEKIGIRAK
jgi:tripartite-type tricarboxylate transporter receptor subunit TctC